MDDLIKIRGGDNKNGLDLQERELAYQTSEKALYIGTSDGNVVLCRAEDIDKIDGKLTATQAEAQASIKADAEIGEVVTALNTLISALKASGIMKT